MVQIMSKSKFQIIISPYENSERPLTSFIKLGGNIAKHYSIEQNDILKVTHNSIHIFLKAQFDENFKFIDEYQNKGVINKRISTLFGGINYRNGFSVESDSLANIPQCDKLQILTSGNKDILLRALVGNNFIVHPTIELLEIGDSVVQFKVVSMFPDLNSLLITENTTIEFVEESEYKGETNQTNIKWGSAPTNNSDSSSPNESIQISSEGLFDIKDPEKSFGKDVLGMDYIEDRIDTLIKLYDAELYQNVIEQYGEKVAQKSNSILLYGPPGCGKTLLAEAIAYKIKNDLDGNYGTFSYMKVKGSELVSKYPGDSEKIIAMCFEEARRHAMKGFVVLFIDEVDTLIPDRGESELRKYDRAMTNQFLQEMNKQYDNLVIVGATNLPFTIDPAAARRFITKLFIKPPDVSVLASIWDMLLSGNGYTNIDYNKLAESTKDYTPAEITDEIFGQHIAPILIEKVSSSMQSNTYRKPELVTTKDILSYITQSKPPTTVAGYISSIADKVDKMGGYPDLKEYLLENL